MIIVLAALAILLVVREVSLSDQIKSLRQDKEPRGVAATQTKRRG